MADTIGFVGLGNIGGPMAINLLKAGFEIVGFDVRRNAAFVDAGGRFASSLDDVARAATVIIHSLPNEAAIDASVEAMLRTPRDGRVLVEMSSYALAAKLDKAQRLAQAGIVMLDCEVSGLPQQVASRKAVIFKAGDQAVIDRLSPVFDGMAERHFNLGPLGAATKMKLIANTMVCVHNLMAAEALNLGRRCGLSPEVMIQVLGPSAAGSNTFNNKAPVMIAGRFENGVGPFRHMFGYLKRTSELAEDVSAATPLLELAQRWYAKAEAELRHDQDIAAIIEVLEANDQEGSHAGRRAHASR